MRLNPTVARLDKLARSTNLTTCRPNRVSTSKQRVTLTLTYDPVGNRTVEQDSLGGLATSTYDAVNHLTSRQFTGNSATARFDIAYTARDEQSVITRYTDLAGTNKIGESDFTYDATGRLTNLQHKDGTGANLANYTYTFDTGNRVTSEVLNGTTTSYQYDSTNQLTNDSTATYTFDATGNRTMAGYATGAGNQMTNDGVYTYIYDSEGNLTKKSKGALAETWNYAYDNANRLTTVTKALTDGGAAVLTATYLYDALNNRIQKSVLDLLAVPPMITPAVTRFALDGWKVTQGAQGARPNFIGNENFDILAELDGSSVLVLRRIYTDQVDQVLIRVATNGTVAHYLGDRLGNIRNITDNAGSIIDTLLYTGFGKVSSESSPANGDSKKFGGLTYDAETGLSNAPDGRYYDAPTGRWQQVDPSGLPPDVNVYRYVRNNATNSTDPSGREGRGPGSSGFANIPGGTTPPANARGPGPSGFANVPGGTTPPAIGNFDVYLSGLNAGGDGRPISVAQFMDPDFRQGYEDGILLASEDPHFGNAKRKGKGLDVYKLSDAELAQLRGEPPPTSPAPYSSKKQMTPDEALDREAAKWKYRRNHPELALQNAVKFWFDSPDHQLTQEEARERLNRQLSMFVRLAGATMEMGSGFLMMAAPEPVLTKIGGGILLFHGMDELCAALEEMAWGESRTSLTQMGAERIGKEVFGLSDHDAKIFGAAVNAGIPIIAGGLPALGKGISRSTALFRGATTEAGLVEGVEGTLGRVPAPASKFPLKPGGTASAYNEATGQGVYVLRNAKTGQIEYVGRGDAPARLLEHARPGSGKEDLIGEILFNNNLPAAKAQSLEQELMQMLGGPKSTNPRTPLRNKIQGIGESNPKFVELEFAAEDELVIEALRRAGLLPR